MKDGFVFKASLMDEVELFSSFQYNVNVKYKINHFSCSPIFTIILILDNSGFSKPRKAWQVLKKRMRDLRSSLIFSSTILYSSDVQFHFQARNPLFFILYSLIKQYLLIPLNLRLNNFTLITFFSFFLVSKNFISNGEIIIKIYFKQ